MWKAVAAMLSVQNDPNLPQKKAVEWLTLDYFRHGPRLPGARWLVVGVAILTALGVVLGRWRAGRRVYQAGPLATAHAPYANDCSRCHTDAFVTAGRLLPANA